MKFDPKIIMVLMNLFNKQEAHIIMGNELSLPFRVERGVRQGDPLSPLLFVLTFEPLLRQLEENLRGIPLGNQSFKLSAYADDLSVGVGSTSDWNTISDWFDIYEKASNAKINKIKTKIIPLTPTAERVVLRNEDQFKKVPEQETFKILGYEINRNGLAKKDLWSQVIASMKRRIEKLKLRDLSYKGKILIANALILSKVWYAAYILNPSRKHIAEINGIISEWIKTKSRMVPKYATFQKDFKKGGLRAPIMKNLMDARLLTIWKRLCNSTSLWAKVERTRISQKIREKRDLTVLQVLQEQNISTKAWPAEWRPHIKAWRRIKGTINATTLWPWPAESLIIKEFKGNQLTVKRMSVLLNSTTKETMEQENIQEEDPSSWIVTQMVPNKRVDIFWRLYHKALPLGYRLKHVNREDNRECPGCRNELQTVDHFMFECEISREVWKEAYKLIGRNQTMTIPTSKDEIFQVEKRADKRQTHAIRWLHVQAVYEIWCLYTRAKWGDGPLSTIDARYKVRARLRNERDQLKANLGGKVNRIKKRYSILTENSTCN